jgi:hypothetical protein
MPHQRKKAQRSRKNEEGKSSRTQPRATIASGKRAKRSAKLARRRSSQTGKKEIKKFHPTAHFHQPPLTLIQKPKAMTCEVAAPRNYPGLGNVLARLRSTQVGTPPRRTVGLLAGSMSIERSARNVLHWGGRRRRVGSVRYSISVRIKGRSIRRSVCITKNGLGAGLLLLSDGYA